MRGTDAFLLWRNEPSVIIGKNQNAYAEINQPFVERAGIAVVRRLTGGGAVFHDLGNVNFTFLTEAGDGGIDFSRFAAVIAESLGHLGVQAYLGGRNDLLVRDGDGAERKISGNAQCTVTLKDGRKRLLHHGTLLYRADLSSLSEALRVRAEKLEGKGIASVRSRVANLADLLENAPDTVDFLHLLARDAAARYGTAPRNLTAEERAVIEQLAREKYDTWEWNYGTSGSFSCVRTHRFPYGTVEAHFEADGGVLRAVRLYGDFFEESPVSALEESLVGCRLSREGLLSALASVGGAGKYVSGAQDGELASLLLGEYGTEIKGHAAKARGEEE